MRVSVISVKRSTMYYMCMYLLVSIVRKKWFTLYQLRKKNPVENNNNSEACETQLSGKSICLFRLFLYSPQRMHNVRLAKPLQSEFFTQTLAALSTFWMDPATQERTDNPRDSVVNAFIYLSRFSHYSTKTSWKYV